MNIFQPREELDGYTMGSLIAKEESLFAEWIEGEINHSQSLIQSLKLSSEDQNKGRFYKEELITHIPNEIWGSDVKCTKCDKSITKEQIASGYWH